MVLSKIILHLLGDLRFCVTCSILANFYVLLCYPERVIDRPIYLQYMQLFRIDALYICNFYPRTATPAWFSTTYLQFSLTLSQLTTFHQLLTYSGRRF